MADDDLIGRTISHYTVMATLGEGGMGVVYRAVDRRLDRTVALKVLFAGKLADPERKRRFVQEAKTASSLNHPNIITIYDIGTAGDLDYIAMEYVSGHTLHRRLASKGLPLPDLLRIAVQIADALAAAHAAGIVHRDLKPANIMITDKGVVKVLDFGLAKLTERALDVQTTATLDAAPRTMAGVVVGTPAYMSPEQAEGKKVDTRSDIFSLGVILYEMVTGHRPFQGDTFISTLSAVLSKEPEPISGIINDVPRELDRLIMRCLRKEPERRVQHMDDLKLALEELKEESVTAHLTVGLHGRAPAGDPALIPVSRFFSWKLVGLAVLLLAFVGMGWWWMARPPAPAAHPVLTRVTFDSGLSTDPALSPDGKLLAYASDRGGKGNLDLWVRQIGGGEPIRLTRDEADAHEPAFSPDGTKIVFRSEREGGGVYVMPALGGEPRLLASHGRNPRYSPDGEKVAFWIGDPQASANVYIVASNGGSPKPPEFRPPLAQSRYPIWSPDGNYLLFSAREVAHGATVARQQEYDWWVASVETGAASQTGAIEAFRRQHLVTSYSSAPEVWSGDAVLFSAGVGEQQSKRQFFPAYDMVVQNDNANLWQIPISPKLGRVTGPPVRLTFGTALDVKPSLASGDLMVFTSLTENIDIWSLPIDANQGRVRGELQHLTQDAALESYPSLSAEGKYMAYWSNRTGNADIWIKDLQSKREGRLTEDPAYETYPIISADGSRIAYEVVEDEKRRSLYLLPLRPGPEGMPRPGVAEKVCDNCGDLSDLSADGEKLLYYDDPARGVTLVNVASREKRQLLQHREHYLADPRFSPDARWVAFHAIVGPVRRQLFIAPVHPDAPSHEREWIPITDGSAMDRLASWSPDGNILYFISERDGFRCIGARRLDPASKKPLGPSFYIYHFHTARRSMMKFQSTSMARLAIARDKIVFSLGEYTGNIWMSRPESAK